MKLTVLTVGKTKEEWLQEALSEYEKRLLGRVEVEWRLFKKEEELSKALDSETTLLDPAGKEMTSEEFARLVGDAGSRLKIAIGGALGFTIEEKRGRRLVSLSRLTFTHQITRLVLLEQVYRAVAINEKLPYHK